MSVLLVLCAAGVAVGVNLARTTPVEFSYKSKSARLAEKILLRKDDTGSHPDANGIKVTYLIEAKDEARLEEIIHFVEHGPARVALLDVRPSSFFDDGHIKGALNLPVGEFEQIYPKHKKTLEDARRVIVYCDGAGCDSAEVVADTLKRLGHAQVVVYHGGWKDWVKHKKATLLSSRTNF
ncbi:MAG: rhodanese-like domain-containing protein [Puniceicoccales bacterium]|nr:rhodanese-like domain-containing protein [Puniceicoccales bacterium]